MAKRKEKAEDGAPAWVVTYGDMMSLLLTFFIILVSMSELKQDQKFQRVMESLRMAFGYKGGIGRVPTEQIPELSLIKQLLVLDIPKEVLHLGSSPDQGVDGKRPRVETVRKKDDWFAGYMRFERFSDELLPGRNDLVKKFADLFRGRTNLVEIVGHTTLEDLPEGGIFASKDDLAFARARQVRDLLVEYGLQVEQLRVISAADHEPLLAQAYTEERRLRNRRVEIMVTESLIHDYEGEELSIQERANLKEDR